MAKEKGPVLPPAPVQPIFNVVLPSTPFGAYPGHPGPLAPPAPPLGPAGVPPTLPAMLSAPLLPAGSAPGPRMSMEMFCQVYNLAGSILSRLRENAYSGTHAFPYMTGDELITLGFKPGELIDLKEAILEWMASSC